jgi:hypothetical protein
VGRAQIEAQLVQPRFRQGFQVFPVGVDAVGVQVLVDAVRGN